MRLLPRALIAGLLITAWFPATARAQQEQPPLEDVTLRGRVLRADGTPLANTPLRVDAVNDSGFAIVAFFATFGLSGLSCFAPPNELCPIPNSKRFSSTTDAHGAYSFTFRNAHRRGQQTDTDYILSIGVTSKAVGDQAVAASYELELLDAVHEAPDLMLWDPAVAVTRHERVYDVAYDRRPSSKNWIEVLVGDKQINAGLSEAGDIDARDVEDAAFTVHAKSSKDVGAAGTIYHQRFVAASVGQKGALVPLSRRAPCTAKRHDGGGVSRCGYTDGDLVTAAVVDPNPCSYGPDGERIVTEDVITRQPVACQPPVTEVTIDLGAAKDVGEVRPRCSCQLSASYDGANWWNLPSGGVLGAPQSMRYVRVTSQSLGSVPEISVWPPWPDKAEAAPVTPDRTPSPGAIGGRQDSDGDGTPWVLGTLALIALLAAAFAAGKHMATTR